MKLFITAVFGLLALIVADIVGAIPKSVIQGFTWAGNNFDVIVFLICFLAVCYVAVKIKGKNRSYEE